MDLKKWFNENIRDKALKVLDQLATQFKDTEGNPDWRKAVTVFSDFCNGTLQPPALDIVNQVIKLLKLSDEVEKLKSFWQNTPQQVRDILTVPLDAATQAITWNILGQANIQTGNVEEKQIAYGSINGPWQSVLNFNTKAKLSLAMQSLALTDSTAIAMGIEGQADERFFKLGLDGQLSLGAGGNLPLGFINLGGSASTQGGATLDYYFANRAKWLFVEAIINDLPLFASPFDSEDLAAQYSHNLKAIQLNVNGSLETSLSIQAEKTFGTNFKVKSKSIDLDTQVDVGASASVGYSADFNLAGSWNLLVKPLSNGYLNLILQKHASWEKKTNFSLNASIGISGLDVVGEAVVRKYMPDATELLNKLQPYLNFGDMLKQELETNLDKVLNAGGTDSTADTLKTQLVATLLGDARAGDLASTLGNAAKTVLNKELTVLTGKAESAGQKILTGVVADLKLPDALGQKLITAGQGKMTEFLTNIQTKIEGAIGKIVAENQDKLASLFKPLEDVGTVVTDLQGDVNKISQQLLGPVITFLTKYQDFRNKVTTAIENSAKLKMALYVGRTTSSTTSSDTMLEFDINTAIPKAREYYKQMLAGNFSQALIAARVGTKGSDGITLVSGKFKAAATSNVQTDISLNIFGAQFTSKTIMSSDVKVEVDVNGNVNMATNHSEYEKVFSALGETRTVNFVNSFELPGAINNQTDTIKILNTGLTMSYKDTRMKESELKAYLGSLENASLVSRESFSSAVQRYNQLADQAAGENKKFGAEIGVNMSFTSRDIQALLAAQPADIVNGAINNQLINYFFNNAGKYQEFLKVLFKWNTRSHDIFGQIRGIASSGKLGNALIKYDMVNPNTPTLMNAVPARDRHYINMAFHIGNNGVNLVKIIQNIRGATQLTLSEETLKSDVKTLNKYNNDTNKYLKNWLKVKGVLASLGIQDESVPAPTLAFIATIGEICQLGNKGTNFLVPSVKWSTLNWQLEEF